MITINKEVFRKKPSLRRWIVWNTLTVSKLFVTVIGGIIKSILAVIDLIAFVLIGAFVITMEEQREIKNKRLDEVFDKITKSFDKVIKEAEKARDKDKNTKSTRKKPTKSRKK